MKKLFKIALCICLVGVLSIDTAHAARVQRKSRNLASVCSSVYTLPNGAFIYKNSAPLRRGGVGTPLVGYRKEPTLIMNRGFARGTTTVYDSAGTKIGSCPWASAHGHAGGRFRCSMSTSSLRRKAVQNTRSPKIFFKLNGNTCAAVPDAGRCYGSVKGLCNSLIA